ncbi:cytochrome P450 6k1-like isoform X3 [Planococcus citri]|uniref:cytochrome P450 6k1-like isoform X3 n=1 Tax=Planococcus citri TaxID=170843 RepID=UPI0031F76FE0
MFFFNSVILLLISSVLYLYWYLKKTYSFFEQHGIPYIKPTPLFGNMTDVILLRKSMAEGFADLYKKLEPHRFAGVFFGTKPMILIRDPDLIKDIWIKDFAYFSDRGWKIDQDLEPLSHHLFTMQNDDWRSLRIKLTNAFTTGKMKLMLPLVKACGEKLSEVIDQTQYDKFFDVKELSSRYTTDVIGNCAFGLQTNSLDDPNAEFIIMGKKLLQFRLRSLFRMFEFEMPQRLKRLLKITFFDLKTQDFFGDIVYKAIDYREKNNVKRNDLLDLLITLKNDYIFPKLDNTVEKEKSSQQFVNQNGSAREIKTDSKITNESLAAQAFIFYLAGFETSSTTLSYALMELSQNQHIQDKVRQEIIDVISASDGQLTYDGLKQMTYTDMVIQETLRKYPSAAVLFRRTVKNYKVADSKVVIPAATPIVLSNYGLHMDEKYFDNPQEFRPERFSEEEKSKRQNYTYLPFGEGPRYCIGNTAFTQE